MPLYLTAPLTYFKDQRFGLLTAAPFKKSLKPSINKDTTAIEHLVTRVLVIKINPTLPFPITLFCSIKQNTYTPPPTPHPQPTPQKTPTPPLLNNYSITDLYIQPLHLHTHSHSFNTL